jgi:alkanesulfonate monooxygenase SsuD/methylene tetrahydromethanopterin reductase-like flavin-dependent oxidoreductase (luciferase family)
VETPLFSGIALESDSVAGHVRLAQDAERAGFRSAWFSEISGPDAVATATACLLGTRDLVFGTAIVPIQVRDPYLMAMSAATLSEIGDGRFTLGVGISTAAIIADWHALPWRPRIALVEEYVRTVRALLAGEIVTSDGAFPLKNARLGRLPPHPVPVVVGAVNEGMVRAAARVADGVLLVYPTLTYVSRVVEAVHDELQSAGRDPSAFSISALVIAATDDEGADAARQVLAQYATFPPYRRAFSADGWADDCEAIARGWSDGGRLAAAAAITPAMLEAHALVGDRAACHRQAAALRDAGIGELLLASPRPLGRPVTDADAGIRHLMQALA